MDIKIKEPLYILGKDNEYVVRAGTSGVEKKRIVFFPDGTRTFSVGFSRDYCLENPQMFQVSRTLTDKDVSVRDVVRVLEESNLDRSKLEELITKVNML